MFDKAVEVLALDCRKLSEHGGGGENYLKKIFLILLERCGIIGQNLENSWRVGFRNLSLIKEYYKKILESLMRRKKDLIQIILEP